MGYFLVEKNQLLGDLYKSAWQILKFSLIQIKEYLIFFELLNKISINKKI